MKLLLSAAAAILLLATFHLTEAGHASASEARHLSDHPVMRSVRKSFVEEIADYFNTWVFHSVDRQARSNFKQIFGVDSNDAMKASTHRSLHTHTTPSFHGQGADLLRVRFFSNQSSFSLLCRRCSPRSSNGLPSSWRSSSSVVLSNIGLILSLDLNLVKALPTADSPVQIMISSSLPRLSVAYVQ